MVQFVSGKTLYESSEVTAKQLEKIIDEAIKIHGIKLRPDFRFDMWQVPNLRYLYDKTVDVLSEDVSAKISNVLKSYDNIMSKKLPVCLVHGDMTKTNIIVSDKTHDVYVLDFGDSDVYPKIHELAIIDAYLLADGKKSLKFCIDKIIDLYTSRGGVLNNEEKENILDYTQAIMATKYLCNVYEITDENETDEMIYWRNISIKYLMADPDEENVINTEKGYLLANKVT